MKPNKLGIMLLIIGLALMAVGPQVEAESLIGPAKSCSGEDGENCEFRCEKGDKVTVSGSTTGSGEIKVTASCGGVSVQCRGSPSCTATSGAKVEADGTGTCSGNNNWGPDDSRTCSAAPAGEGDDCPVPSNPVLTCDRQNPPDIEGTE